MLWKNFILIRVNYSFRTLNLSFHFILEYIISLTIVDNLSRLITRLLKNAIGEREPTLQ